MKNEHLEKLPVNEEDLPGVEEWLEQMAKKGYYLDETVSLWWYFKVEEPKDVRYRLEPVSEKDRGLEEQKREDYAAAGWKYVTTHRTRYAIFMAEDPKTEELHTDPIVKSMALKEYEKHLRTELMLSLVILFTYPMNFMRTLLSEWRTPALMAVNPAMLMFIACTAFFIQHSFRSVMIYRKIRAYRRALASGEMFLPGAETEKQGRTRFGAAANHLSTALIILAVISLFWSFGSGGPVEQELGIRPYLPVLENLESGTVVRGEEEDGSVYYNNSLMLKEWYEVTQEAFVTAEAVESEEEENAAPAGEDGKKSKLEAEYYEAWFSAFAKELTKELAEKYMTSGYRILERNGYDEYLIQETEGWQTLVVRQGRKVLVIRYEGGALLEEKGNEVAAVMAQDMDAGRNWRIETP